MRKYRLIGQEEIEALAVRISLSITKEIQHLGTIITIPDNQPAPFGTEGHQIKRRRKRMGGKSMADLIYENVNQPEFTTKEVAEILGGIIPDWKTPRPLDSVRTAMKNDPDRFEKISEGKYRKK